MKFRRRKQEAVDINLAPLIDVVFILLLFFVVTTTFTRETQLTVQLPEAESGETATPPEQPLEITISADGQYQVNGQALVTSDLANLKRALERESGGKTDQPLMISADGKTSHQAVVTAMDAAGELGFSRLRITTVASQPAP